MRALDKVCLRNMFLTAEALCQSSKLNNVCVPGGGAILHQVHCEKGMKFSKSLTSISSMWGRTTAL